jgi:HAD superfamily hydrolase (TIGR01509 family)
MATRTLLTFEQFEKYRDDGKKHDRPLGSRWHAGRFRAIPLARLARQHGRRGRLRSRTRKFFLKPSACATTPSFRSGSPATRRPNGEQIADAKEQLYRRLVREGGLEPAARRGHWTERLAADGWRQAIASSAPRENIDAVLAVIGLASVFQAMVSAEDVTLGKPDPQVFLTAAARLGSAPAQSIVVEDAPAGIEAARRAGMPSIGVRRKGPPLPANLAVASLADLPPDAFQRLCASAVLK